METVKNKIQFLNEMVDSYNTLHNDYLNTDSISEAEQLIVRMTAIEEDIRSSGATINLSINKWEKFMCALPQVIKSCGDGISILFDALKYVKDTGNYSVLEKLYVFEDTVLEAEGVHKVKKQFYSNTEIFEQIDEQTVVKHVTFRGYIFIKDQANGLRVGNIKAI